MRINELILYKNVKHEDVLSDMALLAKEITKEVSQEKKAELQTLSYDVAHRIVEIAYNHGYKGNLWHMYLTYLLANNENAYSTATEIRGKVEGTINEVAVHDFLIFKEMFDYDIRKIDEALDCECMAMLYDYKGVDEYGKMYNKRVRDRVCDLAVLLSKAESPEEFLDIMTAFYNEFGVGKFGLHKAFRIVHNREDEVEIKPITNIAHVQLEDLVGYEIAKKKLIDNTEAFIEGKPCNNCLLFGAAGTGKSSCIKGILNRYYDKGLRIIEIYKHQFQDLNDVIAEIKNRNYKFIIYMDDLSFEEFEIEYKYLKAVIEGGLEKKPKNILIYATSNRRHLVRESVSDKSDRDDELHVSDTVQEKLSLVYRFGVTIYFGSPSKKEFNVIVTELAKRYGVNMPEEELILEANKWELSHGGLSGRCAQQFIDYLLGLKTEG